MVIKVVITVELQEAVMYGRIWEKIG